MNWLYRRTIHVWMNGHHIRCQTIFVLLINKSHSLYGVLLLLLLLFLSLQFSYCACAYFFFHFFFLFSCKLEELELTPNVRLVSITSLAVLQQTFHFIQKSMLNFFIVFHNLVCQPNSFISLVFSRYFFFFIFVLIFYLAVLMPKFVFRF